MFSLPAARPQVYKRQYWTESFVQWSPRGNLLATIHRQGVAVWGGPSFTRLQRFNHGGEQAHTSIAHGHHGRNGMLICASFHAIPPPLLHMQPRIQCGMGVAGVYPVVL